MKMYEELEKLEKAQGTNNKKEILYQAIKNYPALEKYFRLTYDDRIYGISDKIFEKIIDYKYEKDGHYFDIGDLLYNKINGILSPDIDNISIFLDSILKTSGNKLIEELKFYFLVKTPLSAKWISRLILKDLKIGISQKTINDVFEELGLNKIEKFGVQLCDKIDNIEDFNEFPCFASIKYDGFRCIVEKRDNIIKMTSRQGKDVSFFLPELVEEFKKIPADFILDGEVMASTFNEIQQRIGRKDNFQEIKDLHYRAFDILYVYYYKFSKDTEEDFSTWVECARWNALIEFMQRYIFGEVNAVVRLDHLQSNSRLIRLEYRKIFHRKDDLLLFYKQVCDQKLEGIIIKKYNGLYEKDKRKNWIKVKPIFENTFKIIDYKYGSGKKAGLIATIIVTDKNNKIKSGVGSGLTDKDIIYIMNLEREKKLLGTCIDVAYNEISENKFGEISLRFPRFLKFREDKSEADDINI
jgi:DNA ligase-1